MFESTPMDRSLFPRIAPWLVVCALASSACRHHHGTTAVEDVASEDGALVSDSSDTVSASSQSASLARPFFAALDAASVADVTTAAKSAENGAAAGGFFPAGCATVTSSGASATTTFDGCSGAFGLASVSGSVRADYGKDDVGRLAVRLADLGDLRINGKTAVYQATLLVTFRDAEPVVTWNATWTATNHAGRVVHHDSSIDVAIDSAAAGGHCVTISGATHGWVIEPVRGIDTVIDGYRVCPDECPLAGTITSTGHLAHRTITVAFDGSSFAHVTAPKRGTFEVPLVCDE